MARSEATAHPLPEQQHRDDGRRYAAAKNHGRRHADGIIEGKPRGDMVGTHHRGDQQQGQESGTRDAGGHCGLSGWRAMRETAL